MRWINDLNAAPRLMLGFGTLLLLLLATNYLALSSLARANDRIGALYQQDMAGAIEASNIARARLSIGRQGRDAILNMNQPAIVAADERMMLRDFAIIHANLDTADKSFYTKESLDTLAVMRSVLPPYEAGYHGIYERVHARDEAGARQAMFTVSEIGNPLSDASERAIAIKERLGSEKFEANNTAYMSGRSMLILVSGVSVALGVLLSLWLARSFSAPLAKAVTALEGVASGNLTVWFAVDTQDEVGKMATALNQALAKLRATLQEVSDSAINASAASQQLAAAAESIAAGSGEQAASLEETAASLEEITATVRQSAENARHASELALSSKSSAEHGRQVVSSAVGAMGEINAASIKIADIISTIEEIAFQTNLLAVNAAVEAARAGEGGRGFAVVASEVRSLAQRSAGAAKEIKALIQDSLRKVEKGSELVNQSDDTLQGIVNSVTRVTETMSEIAAAAEEQTVGIQQVNGAMTQMDQVTQSNAAQTEELSSTAQALSEQSARLMELVSTFVLSREPARSAVGSFRPSGFAASTMRSRYPGAETFRKSGVRSVTAAALPGEYGSGGGKGGRRDAMAGRKPAAADDDSCFEEF